MEISKITRNKSVSGNLAELLGLLCAEGNYREFYANYLEFDKRRNRHYFRKNKRERILEFSNKNITLLNFFRTLLQKEYNNYFPKILKSKKDVKRICITKYIIINDILGHTSIGCDKWKVTELITSGSNEIKKRFIRGFFNGDGCIDKTHDNHLRFRFTSVNRRGIEGIADILTELNIGNNLNGPYARKNRRPCFEILIQRKSNQRFINNILSHDIAGKMPSLPG